MLQAFFIGVEGHEGTISPGPPEVIVDVWVAFQSHDRDDEFGRDAGFNTNINDLLCQMLRFRMHEWFELFCRELRNCSQVVFGGRLYWAGQ